MAGTKFCNAIVVDVEPNNGRAGATESDRNRQSDVTQPNNADPTLRSSHILFLSASDDDRARGRNIKEKQLMAQNPESRRMRKSSRRYATAFGRQRSSYSRADDAGALRQSRRRQGEL